MPNNNQYIGSIASSIQKLARVEFATATISVVEQAGLYRAITRDSSVIFLRSLNVLSAGDEVRYNVFDLTVVELIEPVEVQTFFI